jgi:hypothetical protein
MLYSNVSPGDTIAAAIINAALYQFQQPAGGQEIGHYWIGGNAYTNGAFLSCIVGTQNRYSTPVAMSIDTSDNTPSTQAPGVTHAVAGGAQVVAQANAGAVLECGGIFTVQF